MWNLVHKDEHIELPAKLLDYVLPNNQSNINQLNSTNGNVYLLYNTGWRRLIKSPKLQIIFHKRAIKYRLLLRKMTHNDKGSYESSPPCTTNVNTKWDQCEYEMQKSTNVSCLRYVPDT